MINPEKRQTDRYLGELVRYIHLNPVRARTVIWPEDFPYSGHRASLGVDESGADRCRAGVAAFRRPRSTSLRGYQRFVEAAIAGKSQKEYYRAGKADFLAAMSS